MVSAPRFVGEAGSARCSTKLLGRARAGTGGALVPRGEAGIGETVLLDDVVARARLPGRADGGRAIGDGTPLRGIAAALQPLLDKLERLPAPQGEAISLAFGLTVGLHRTASLSA